MKTQRNIFIVTLYSLLLSSCSYHGGIEKDFYITSSANSQKISISVYVSDSDRYIKKIRTTNVFNYTFDVKDGILLSVQHALSDIIAEVWSDEEPLGKDKAKILKFIASNYVLNDASLCATYRKPFSFIAEGLSCSTWLPG